MKKGITKDWGAFTGKFYGYSVVEGTEVEILKQIQQYWRCSPDRRRAYAG